MARGTEAVLRDRTQLGAFDRIRAIKEGKGRRSAFLEDSASDGPDSPDPPTPREPAKRVDRTRSLSLSESDGKENAQQREMPDCDSDDDAPVRPARRRLVKKSTLHESDESESESDRRVSVGSPIRGQRRKIGRGLVDSESDSSSSSSDEEDAAEDSDDDYAGDSDDLSNALSGVTLEAKAPVAYRAKPAPFAPTMPTYKKAPARVAAPASSDPPPPGPSPLHAERLRRHSRADQGGTRGQEARAGAQEARRARPAAPRADRDDDN